MAGTTLSWGLGRRNILEVYKIQAARIEKQWKWLLGNTLETTQIYEFFKQMRGLAPADPTPEGEPVKYDNYTQLFTRSFTPGLFTKGIKYTELADFTNQYKDIIAKQPDFALAFGTRKNLQAASLYNLGFTDTTMGQNSETLFSTSHSMGGSVTGANTPLVNISFGPLAIEQMITEIRGQKDANNQPMMLTGGIQLMVPYQLEGKATRYVKSLQLAGTNNNDTNEFIKSRIELQICDYFSSATAFFGRMVDNQQHKLFILFQLPYDMKQLAMTDDLYQRYVARESYIVGWSDWHGTWGALG